MQLPGTTTVVTCGRFAQETTIDGNVVGSFVYGRQYRERADAVPLDPYHLPLTDRTQTTAALGGIFGALRDASPDAWGRGVIQRALARTDLTEVDYLLQSPQDRAGALSFGRNPVPPSPTWAYNQVVRLGDLYEAARLIEQGVIDPIPAHLRTAEALLNVGGTSMGGARPKNVVEDASGLWIAKFPARGDKWNNAPVEAGLLALARRCGITAATTRIERIGDAEVLLVQRFDRERIPLEDGDVDVVGASADARPPRYRRARMVSALTVLDADDSPQLRGRWSYVLLAEELQRWSRRPEEDQRELFRRMVFNALVSNLDDHPRNHALIAPGDAWHLAPAYDLTPDPRLGRHDRQLAMVAGRYGFWARRANLRTEAARFALTPEAADVIMDDMVTAVRALWEGEIRREGASVADCAQIAPAFMDEGFEYPYNPGW